MSNLKYIIFVVLCLGAFPCSVLASGYGVFTQGASGLGQANAVVAHPTGPSSLYFNPALLNDVPGRQFEVGTTAIYSKRAIDLDTGGTGRGDSSYNFPSSFYYTHQVNDKLSAGIGVFFPFGLSNEWDKDYEGRYIGTKGEMFTMNINPAVSVRVTDKLSLAAGVDLIYLDSDLRRMINQPVVGLISPPAIGGPFYDPSMTDVEQKFTGDGWGGGFNLGAFYRVTDRVSIGAGYRSKVSVDLEGNLDFDGNDPRLALMFLDGNADTTIDLPAQFVAGVASKVTDDLTIEVGVRWEDWDVNDELTLDLQYPFLGESSLSMPRDWKSTWAYNIGGHYRVNDVVSINAGYLYGETPVPNSTFEPIIPDTDVHVFTVGTDLTFGQWIVSGAFGYEYHGTRDKNNGALVNDPLGSLAAGMPVNTADGDYDTDIYLVGLSVGYRF